jgi:hypothetical protein
MGALKAKCNKGYLRFQNEIPGKDGGISEDQQPFWIGKGQCIAQHVSQKMKSPLKKKALWERRTQR